MGPWRILRAEVSHEPGVEVRMASLRLIDLPFLKLRWEGGRLKASSVKRRGRRVQLSKAELLTLLP